MKNLTKSEITEIIGLKQKKERTLSGLFLGEGLNFFLETKKQKHWFDKVIVSQEFADENKVLLKEFERILCIASQKEIGKISDTASPQTIVCVMKDVWKNLTSPSESEKKILYLYNIQDPGNCGTLIRSAAWFNWDAVVLSHQSVDWKNPKVIRSTMGAFQSIKIFPDNSDFDLLVSFSKNRSIFRLNMQGAALSGISGINKDPLVVVVGNESNGFIGFPEKIGPFIDVTIPGYPANVESLNASVAGSLAMYELSK